MMLDAFKTCRKELLEFLDELKDLAQLRTDQQVIQSIAEIKEKVLENVFYLVVLGQFKRGKSTLINSLLGARLLPTAVVPLTSIVTMLQYGPEERIDVHLQTGGKRSIGRGQLLDFVTEKGNPGNQKKVSQVIISYPSEYLKDGVRLIDTPGVGSIFSDNTQVTYNFLPRVDAAIFLLAVDPPISHSELDFLKDIKQYVEKIFFVQNKIDYLDEQDRMESMEFSKQVIEQALGDGKVNIYPLSAKLALEAKESGDEEKLQQSFLPVFDQMLGDFLTREKGAVLLKSALQSSRKLLADEEFSVRLAQRAAASPLHELEEKIAIFETKLKEIEEQKQDNDYLYEAEIKRLMDLLDRDLNRLRKERLPRLMEELRKAGERERHLPAPEYVKFMEKVLREGVVATFDEWIGKQEERLNDNYARVSKQFSDRANEIIESLLQASASMFEVPLERVASDTEITSDTRFYYLLGDQPRFFDIVGLVDYLSHRFLPKSISQSKVLRDIMKKLPARIDANCGRVRADFKYRIQQSFLKFRWNLNLKIDSTAESIRQALGKAMEMKKAGATELERLSRDLAEQLERVERLKERAVQLEALLKEM